jgi:uncharacterized UPF0146 family protein
MGSSTPGRVVEIGIQWLFQHVNVVLMGLLPDLLLTRRIRSSTPGRIVEIGIQRLLQHVKIFIELFLRFILEVI